MLLLAGPAARQAFAQVEPVPGEATFTIFVRGTDVGREQVNLTRSGSQWIITATGQLAEFTLNRLELRYAIDWQPIELHVEGTQTGKPGDKAGPRKVQLATSFALTTAINEITQNGVTNSKTDQISARTVVLPTNVFAGYEALAARLANSTLGTEIPTYIAAGAEVKVIVKGISDESVTTPAGIVQMQKYELLVNTTAGGTLTMTVSVDRRARLARVDLPSANLSVVRSELAGVSARTLTARNPTDSDVTVPANGFSLAGTMTRPPVLGRLRLPVIVLVAGSGPVDRDGTVAGIPILSQLAGGLAAQGFLVLRYDKRAVGQSGGRSETVTQQDYADDLIAIVKWLAKRDDVDPRRIAVAGHSEGAMIGMLAAAREKKIGSLVLMSTSGTRGRRPPPRAAAARARSAEGPGSRTGSEGGPAKADSSGRHRRNRMGRAAGRRAEAGRYTVVQKPSALRPGGADAEAEAADSGRPGRPRRAGPAAPRRQARGARAGAQEGRGPDGGRAFLRPQPPPRARHDGRGAGVSGVEREGHQPGDRDDHRCLAAEVAAVSGID